MLHSQRKPFQRTESSPPQPPAPPENVAGVGKRVPGGKGLGALVNRTTEPITKTERERETQEKEKERETENDKESNRDRGAKEAGSKLQFLHGSIPPPAPALLDMTRICTGLNVCTAGWENRIASSAFIRASSSRSFCRSASYSNRRSCEAFRPVFACRCGRAILVGMWPPSDDPPHAGTPHTSNTCSWARNIARGIQAKSWHACS